MVTFKLVEETEEYLVYWYYPNGKEELKPGIIIVDKINGKIDITELAEDDWERDISVEELNELAESVNREIREEGGTDFLELATEPEHSVLFGDHAVNAIWDKLREGIVPKKGARAWY